ncbi:MAG TPA: hypothetical protein VJ840_14330 [Gemmatimonadaceae bacterium]|nr:hypothetical protein [Gemmatimonadaceae bacterium]
MVQDDWSVQLKKLEREFDGLPPEPSPAFKKFQSEEERRAQERARQRTALIGVVARLVLVGAVGVALLFWPYANNCGFGLFGFLGAEAVIVIGGVWIAISSWMARLPRMHILSLAIVFGGIALMAGEILPRVGYAAVDPKNPPHFSCPDSDELPTPNAPATSNKSTQNALPGTSAAEQRVQSAANELHSRWESRVTELSKQFQPQKAALTRLERRELLSRQSPRKPSE